MNRNKKIVIIAVAILAVVFLAMSACKRGSSSGEVVVVTDKNGVPVTNENGEAITVVLETEIVDVTNANGEKVYDENGNVKTSVIYHSKDVGIPVTNSNGEVVTDSNGKTITTMITVPPATGGPVVSNVPLTDSNGNYVTKTNGETVTYTMVYTTSPATPGDNSSNWGTTFGGSGNDLYTAVESTPDGGCIALVQTNSKDGSLSGLADGAGVPYMVLIKYNSDGKLQWQKAVSGNDSLVLNSLTVDESGNIFAAGYTKSTNLGFDNYGDYDAIVYKFNSAGDIQWLRNFGGTMTDAFNAISIAPDGGVVAAGISASADGNASVLGLRQGYTSPSLVKFDADGNIAFAKTYGAIGDSFTGVSVAKDGSIYTVGNFSSKDAGSIVTNMGKSDAVIMRYDGGGNNLWVAPYGGSKIENFSGITATSDGCVVAGRTQSSDNYLEALGNQGGYDAVLVKYSQSGALEWNTAFRGYYDDSFSAVKQKSDGSFVACGYSYSSNRDLKTVGNRGACDGIIVAFDQSGQVASAQGYGGSNEDKFTSICILNSGEYIACGSTLSTDGDLVGARALSDGANTVGMIARFK